MTPPRKAETVARAPRGSSTTSARGRTKAPPAGNTPKPAPLEPLKNVTFYAPRRLVERVKNAQVATAKEPRGHRSFNALVSSALMTETSRLERLYNDGKPYKAVPPGGIKRGRREIRLRDVEASLVHESFAQRPSDTNHARGAWLATRFRPTGYDSFAEMIAGALEREATRLERAYNERKAFPTKTVSTPAKRGSSSTTNKPTARTQEPVGARTKASRSGTGRQPKKETDTAISGGSRQSAKVTSSTN